MGLLVFICVGLIAWVMFLLQERDVEQEMHKFYKERNDYWYESSEFYRKVWFNLSKDRKTYTQATVTIDKDGVLKTSKSKKGKSKSKPKKPKKK